MRQQYRVTNMNAKSLYKDLCRTKTIDMSDVCRRHLQAGDPIYYTESGLPENQLIKQYPDGRREILEFDSQCGQGRVIGQM